MQANQDKDIFQKIL